MSQKKKKIEEALGNLFSGSKKNVQKNQSSNLTEDQKAQNREKTSHDFSATAGPTESRPADTSLPPENRSENLPSISVTSPEEKKLQPAPGAKVENGNEKIVKGESKEKEQSASPKAIQTDLSQTDLLKQPASQPSGNGKGAQAAPSSQVSDEVRQLVVFNLADEAFGLPIDRVESIIKTQTITVVPHARPFVVGVTNLRGTVLPVIDLRRRFNMPAGKEDDQQRIVVVNFQDEKIGLRVDSVSQVLSVPAGAIEPPPPLVTAAINTAFITAIAKIEEKLVILLDLDKILIE